MQFKLATDYAIRCVLFLAGNSGSATAEMIGREMGISHNYTQRILQDLKKAGLVTSIQGSMGGFVLAKKPEEIRMIDLVAPEEQTLRLNRCLEDDAYCSCDGVRKKCPVHAYYQGMQRLFDRYLEGTTVRDLMKVNAAPKKRAGRASA